MPTQFDKEDGAKRKARMPWGLALLGAAVLFVAALIFSSAGPDRSRTADLKDTSPYGVNPRNSSTTERTVPNVDMPTAPKSN